MVGYVFLVVSVLAGAVKGFCGKKVGNYTDSLQSAVLLNLVRMLLCVVLSTAIVLCSGQLSQLVVKPRVLWVAAISGVSNAVFVVSWLFAVRRSAYMLVDVFLMLGALVPLVLGSLLYAEPISLRQWIGFAVLVIAVLIMCTYNSTICFRLTPGALCALLICGLSNGITDAGQKSIVTTVPELPVSVFTVYTYIFAAATLGLTTAVIKGNTKVQVSEGSVKKLLIYITVMSAALTANSYFKTLAARHLDSVQLYPLSQGLSLAFSSAMAAGFFKEKLTNKALAGILLAFAALLMINL